MDGATQYVDCGNITTLNGAQNASWSFWVKFDSFGGWQTTVSLFGSSTAITAALTYTIYSQTDNPSNGCVLFAGGAGDIELITVDCDTVLFKGIVAGQFLPVQVKRVKATNTTATDIVALW